jgi:uncharacterized small protein (DUF1192 family)
MLHCNGRRSSPGTRRCASRLAGEPLDSYSQDELMERIEMLEAEIERVRAQHAKAASHRSLADSLFKPREPS